MARTTAWAAELAPVGEGEAGDAPPLEPKGAGLAFDDGQARLGVDQRMDRRLVALAVGLDARAADRGALAGVEHAIVDRGVVRGARDQAVIGVDLADQMALAEPAHRRIARHRADLAAAEADQSDRRAQPRRRGRSLGPGMAAADHDDVEILRSRRRL